MAKMTDCPDVSPNPPLGAFDCIAGRSASIRQAVEHATLVAATPSELLGHEKGAFTGATARKQGLFELAAEGTLSLDEIHQLPLNLQPKSLRALEARTVRPLGSTREVSVRCRIVAATSVALEEAVARAEFRPDLYYRLGVFHVEAVRITLDHTRGNRSAGARMLGISRPTLARMIRALSGAPVAPRVPAAQPVRAPEGAYPPRMRRRDGEAIA